MPTIAETKWGVWGEPLPQKPWKGGPELSHIDGGGSLKDGFSETLKWYYKNARNPVDKEQCLKLLTQIEIRKEDALKVGKSKERPQSAATLSVKASPKQLHQRPQTAQPGRHRRHKHKQTYRQQAEATQRLSRPKTASSRQANYHSNESRPKSAMATIGRKRFDDPYLTTHEREFQGYPSGLYGEATRPMSSKGFTAPYNITDPLGLTTCQTEYDWKKCTRVDPIVSGSSSGNRKNNPHPHESFMVWKLPRHSANTMTAAPAAHLGYRTLTDNVFDQILKDQLKSTYQNDYLGIPQGYQVKDAIDAPEDWHNKIRRPLDTTVRRSYKGVNQHRELAGNVTRYGCNQNKSRAAVGAVPTVTSDHVKNQEQIKGKTTYHSQFANGMSQPDLMKLLNAQTNSRVIDRFLRYSKADKATKTQIRESSGSPVGGRSSQKEPKWMSGWQGAHYQNAD